MNNVVPLQRRQWFAELALDCFNNGYAVLPATGKAVYEQGWSSLTIDAARVEKWLAVPANAGRNIGLRTGDGIIAIDIDVLDDGAAAAIEASARETFGDGCMVRIGRAPKRLLVFACDDPGHTKRQVSFVDGDEQSHKVELLAKGQQFIAYGIHPDTKLEYRWTTELEPAVTEPWELDTVTAGQLADWFAGLASVLPADWQTSGVVAGSGGDTGDDTWLERYRRPLDVADEEVRDALLELDPDMEHDEWVKVGMALHHQYRGDPVGLEMWDAWSAEGSKYQSGVCETRWASFKVVRDGGAVTLASVLKQARAAKNTRVRATRLQDTETWRARFAAAADRVQLDEVAEAAAKDCRDWPRTELEILVSAFTARFKALTGVRLPVADARAALGVSADRVRDARAEGGGDLPLWLRPWVYNTETDKLLHLRTKSVVSAQGFNALHNREILDQLEFLGSAYRAATDVWPVPCVAGLRYLPYMGELFELDGVQYVNRYKHALVPETPDRLTEADEEAVAIVQQHLAMIVPDDVERGHLTQWLAFNVQRPGVKIRWAPLIKGMEGDGKSVLLTLLGAAMGGTNVAPVFAHLLQTDFTGWADEVCVVGIEELRLQGHNRYDILNKLKPFITNGVVSIHRKGREAYKAPNVTNYLCFTNFPDALPVDDTDRRYFILFTPFTEVSELLKACGGDTDAYFMRLHHAIEQHPGAMRQWLTSVDLEGFRPSGRAPDTFARRTMVEMSAHDDEEKAKELLSRGALGVSADVVSSAHLTRALQAEGGFVVETRRVNALLGRLGFQFVERLKWQNEMCRVWVRAGLKLGDEAHGTPENRASIRLLLDKTQAADGTFD